MKPGGGTEARLVWTKPLVAGLITAARDQSRVSGLTHSYYRYPARFSPTFVRAAIKAFTQPGDLVLDPFVGGGTTLVEAMALGRHSIGVDISSLATFIAGVKTTVLSEDELKTLTRWLKSTAKCINPLGKAVPSEKYFEAGYYRHLGTANVWRLRKSFEQSLDTVDGLRSANLKEFARCVILRTAQWALDGRKTQPSVMEFRESLIEYGLRMIEDARKLREAVDALNGVRPTATCLHRSAVGIETDPLLLQRRPRLVLTSPPYPGVHVLYHRWQIDGGKESPAPFWLANKLDGAGAAYYTLGDRKATQNNTYFDGLEKALKSLAQVCDQATVVVQVVAFSNPRRQLPRYLEVNAAAGFEEFALPDIKSHKRDGRLWRTVPNRRWHAETRDTSPASKEVVLFHRLRA